MILCYINIYFIERNKNIFYKYNFFHVNGDANKTALTRNVFNAHEELTMQSKIASITLLSDSRTRRSLVRLVIVLK